MRLDQCLQQATTQLAAVSTTPRLDAQLLLAQVMAVDTTYFYTWPDKIIPPVMLARFNTLLLRRCQGEPIAYILGVQAFWNLELEVADCTLIPRPDTEVLVDVALEKLASYSTTDSVLDLGTGTGAVALAILMERPNVDMQAVDLLAPAVELARRNAAKYGLPATIYQSNWFAQVPMQKFTLIVANPPYIDPEDPHLQRGDVRFEPKSALVAERQGLADIETIIQQARSYLAANAWLAIEHGYQQGQACRELLSDYGYQQISTRQDYGQQERVSMGLWPS